jgi:hypothetical protein
MEIKIRKILLLVVLLIIFQGDSYSQKLQPPDYGIYHGAFPDMGATEDSVTTERILAFDSLTGNPAIWVYFSNNWFKGIKFPQKEVEIISALEKIPFIRMMPRSGFIENKQDPIYTMKKIIDGKFDKELIQYAKDARNFGKSLIIEFGTEVNGDWFSWNGKYNGGEEKDNYGNPDIPDGPERFRDAYKHIINIFRAENANNVTWVFHVSDNSSPEEDWNLMSAYYPGDDYIDWIGVSIYGSQEPGEQWNSFTDLMDKCYIELCGISKSKPLAVLEFGVIEDPVYGNKAKWIQNALQSLRDNKYSRIKAMSYWHSIWQDENGNIINMRLDSSPGSINTYKRLISDEFFRPKSVFK